MKTIAKMLDEGIKIGGSSRALFDENTTITYNQFQNMTDNIAAYLQNKGLKVGDIVAIVMPRTIYYLVVECACLRYGYGALLLDTHYPQDRIDFCINDSGAKLVFDDDMYKEAVSFNGGPNKVDVPEDTPATVAYTSGSTGRPKGVLHDQASIGLFMDRMFDVIKPDSTEICGAVAPFTFAAHFLEAIRALCAGGCSTPIDRELVMNPIELAEFIDKHQITNVYLPPKIAKLFHQKGDSLRVVLTASEPVRDVAPEGYKLYNCYGMSEIIVVLIFDVDKAYENTPIGKPLKGCNVYLLDENDQITDEGEICVSGHFFTEYIGLPEKTAATKVKNPFYEQDGEEYMIRTGDIAKRLPDGNILYVQRKDWMVKINGQRVEPGEVEHIMRSVDGIKDVAVKGFTQEDKSYLCAFYVADNEVQEEDIIEHLKSKLPDYMIPERMARMDSLPLNANGKLDRLSLMPPAPKTECVEPATKEEEIALDIAKNLIKDIDFGVTDDLDGLGMDSSNAMRFSVELQEAGIKVNTSTIMKHHNIRAILSSGDNMMWFVEEYDATKPILVITSGIVVLRPVLPFYQNMSSNYNILLIEPVQDHYEHELKGLSYDELVKMYMDGIVQIVPDVNNIIGFMGFSFGGELSASLAKRFEELYSRKTFAILGDTIVKRPDEYFDREVTKDDLAESIVKGMKEKIDSFLVRLNMINGFGYGEKYAKYDGPTTLIDAGVGYTEEEEKAKIDNAKERYANLTIIPMKHYTHSDLFRVMDLLPFYVRLIEENRNK